MALDNYKKMQIAGLLKNSLNDIYISDFRDIIKKTKYTFEDIVIYLTEKLEQELTKEELANIINKIILSISIIIENYAKNVGINQDLIQKIYKLTKTCKEKTDDETTINVATELKETLEYFYPQIKHTKKEKVTEKVSSEIVKKLESELKEDKKKIEELEEKINRLQNKINRQNKDYDILKQQKIELGEIKNKLEAELKRLEKSIDNQDADKQSLNDKIKNISTKLENSLKKIETYQRQFEILQETIEKTKQDYDSKIESLESINKELTKQIANTQQRHKKMEEKAKKTNLVNKLILAELYLHSRINIDDIVSKAKQMNINCSHQEIYKLIVELKQKINIEGPLLDTFPPSYKIDKSAPTIDKPFYYAITPNTRELDILICSDMHTDCMIALDSLRHTNDIVYSYAASHNVAMILNLGDIFEIYRHLYTKNLDNLKIVREIINKFINSIPENTGIYQGFLGGNHDKEILAFGIDPLAKMANQREDLINLGYSHRKIQLGNIRNQLLLHHPEKRFQEDVLFSQELQNYLNNFYSCPKSREDIYCDLIAHTHRSKLDIINSYCMVPSLTRDRVKNGCWHLKIYLDEKQDISYMNFMPLVVENKKLRPVTEIPYQKIRKPN